MDYAMKTLRDDEENDHFKLYCLEGVENIETNQTSKLLPFLNTLALDYGISSLYKNCDTMEGFEEHLGALLHEDKNFRDYKIIYLVFKGDDNLIELDGYFYTLEEVAELFEGKLTGKIIHFSNTKMLDLEDETFQYFLDVTGAKAISGYINSIPLLSTILDAHYFQLYKEIDDVVELVEELFDKHSAICQAMGFRLYY